MNGPLIVAERDSTTLVPPGARASLDPWENILISLDARGRLMSTRAGDPFLLEVLQSGFETIADNLAVTIMRSAYCKSFASRSTSRPRSATGRDARWHRGYARPCTWVLFTIPCST